VQVGMGDPLLITTLVVIVIGGIGSVKGAFLSALLVGVVDTLGRAFLPSLLRLAVPGELADAAGPALASLSIFILMAGVLAMRPQGLFASKLG
jgi:branched-chain amino acid transport system permease protein